MVFPARRKRGDGGRSHPTAASLRPSLEDYLSEKEINAAAIALFCQFLF
jgi:hypothetical protein